jgi:predicted PurR-regulated permease PerM
MTDQQKSRKFRRVIVYSVASTVGFLFVAGLLYGMKPMLLPFAVGAFLAYLFKPIVNYQGPMWAKHLRSIFLFFSIGLGVYSSVKFVKENLPNEKEKLELKVRLQYKLNGRFQDWMGLSNAGKGNFLYKSFGDEIEPIRQKVNDYLQLNDDEKKLFSRFRKNQNPGENISDRIYDYYLVNLKIQKEDYEKQQATTENNIAVVASNGVAPQPPEPSALANILHTFTHWIIMPLAFMFILLDKGQIVHFFMRLIPNRYFELTYAVLEHVDVALGKYIRGTMVECALVGITLIAGFYLCGIDLKIAIAIGAIGGITNAIPFVGTIIACVIGALYSLIAEEVNSILPFVNENNLMLAVICVVMIAHLLDNAIFQPLVVGSAVNLHPLVVILGVFGGSMMFGAAGLIFAIPTIVILKVVTETFFSGLKEYHII